MLFKIINPVCESDVINSTLLRIPKFKYDGKYLHRFFLTLLSDKTKSNQMCQHTCNLFKLVPDTQYGASTKNVERKRGKG